MTIKKNTLTALAIVLTSAGILVGSAGSSQAQERKFINIGSGGITGQFYASAGYICDLVNKSRKSLKHNLRCTVESSAGSIGNLRGIQRGELDVAVAQSDWQYHSYRGTSRFKEDGKNKDVRFLMSLHHDMIHVLVQKGSGIKTLDDLRGKRVNTGNVGSGTEGTTYEILKYAGIDPKDFKLDSKLTSREVGSALCDDKIDVLFTPQSPPGSLVIEPANLCDIEIVPIEGPGIDKLVADSPYYSKSVIPGGIYRGVAKSTATFGVVATLVANGKNLSEEAAYILIKSVFDNFESFKKRSQSFSSLTRKGSSTAGRTVPYHPGALRYYKEVGLVK